MDHYNDVVSPEQTPNIGVSCQLGTLLEENNTILEIHAMSPKLSEKKVIEDNESPKKSTIKHIVLSGGCSFIITVLGILKESNDAGYWDYSNLKSIYGTSAGAIIGLAISLGISLDILVTYMLKRPWHRVFKLNMNNVLNAFHNCGIVDITPMEDMITPLLKSKDLSVNITMKELYQHTNIDLHLYCVQIDDFDLVDISHTTHPDWKVVDAVYASACLPILFVPLSIHGKLYCDGGLLCNYPINYCYDKCIADGDDINEIFGINYNVVGSETDTEKYTLFDYFIKIIFKMNACTVSHKNIKNTVSIPNEIHVNTKSISFFQLYLVITESNERKRLVDDGMELWREHVKEKSI
jgi:predicted acylesterase/phospholipase RssA